MVVVEPNIDVIDILGFGINDTNTFLDGTDEVRVQKESLNVENDKITISGWIKPDFSGNTMQLAVTSKSDSFELFVTGHKDPKHHAGFSVYNGEKWNTVFGDSVVSESWHHITGVVNMSDFFVFLDGQLDGTGTLDTVPSLDERGRLVQQNSTINTSEGDIIVGSLETRTSSASSTFVNHYSGTIFDLSLKHI